MSVRGSLRTMSFEDVLSWLSRRLVCGTLTLEHGATVRSFICDSGYFTSSSSNDPGEELGQVLLSSGLVDEPSLGEARQVQADTGVPLSRILTMVGKVSEERIRAALEERVMHAVLDVFTWDEGTFAVERTDDPPETAELAIAVQLRVCLEEGRQRAARWREIRDRVPADDVVLEIADRDALTGIVFATEPGHAAELEAVVAAVERGRSIEQMMAELGLARFALFECIIELLDHGGLAMPGVHSFGPDASPGDIFDEARRLAAAGARAQALEFAQRARAAEPDDAEIEEFCRATERALFAELSRELLSSFRVPLLLVERSQLEALELSDDERRLVGRVDGRWDLLSLMRSSPLRDAEALITFKRLADRGIIAL